MANSSENNSNQMERLTTCPICLNKFRSPKVLPCMHTFCLTPCLTNLVDPRARSLRCPECRREHVIPAGGVQAFPANLTMIGFLDLQPSNISQPGSCFVCKEQKAALTKCHDCSKYICSDCREGHLREASFNIRSVVSQLRRALPRLSDKIASYEQRVNSVKTNHEQIQREISSAIAALIQELKYRETALFTEAEVYMQSQLRMFRLQQETAEVELASVASFCESVETSFANSQTNNDIDLANIRSQCNRYSQQIETLNAQVPTDVQKLRFTFDNQAALSGSIQNSGHLIDVSNPPQSPTSISQVVPIPQSRFQPPRQLNSSMNYVSTMSNPIYTQDQSQVDQYRHLENLYYSRGSTASRPPPTYAYRPTQNHFSGSAANPFVDLSLTVPARSTTSYTASWDSQTPRHSSSIFGSNPFGASNVRPNQRPQAPPEPSTRRNHVTSTTAARSLEGDSRPIFGGGGGGGGGRGRDLVTTNATTIQEQERESEPPPPPAAPGLQRRGTFVLEESTLPNLPQSSAQRPRDTVIVQELYNVRARTRAQTPVAFTINLNEAAQSSPTPTTGNGAT
ncbi:unnamed protein product [Rotaria socialis]|uniref:RING-type domain-containing protein n=2 Tax=Rotaria socialis TaxID=392032 RepID=A0A818KVE5_9BILA|nr:unnamed protein product [Rotaria socialis]CAF4585779.1 unnamed protein product [Rotaria socialis]